MKKKDLVTILIVIFLAAGLTIGGTGEIKVSLKQEPLDVSDVKDIGGYVGQRVNANKEGYLKAFDIDLYTRMVEEKKHRDWWWIGEQPGKWLESAVLSSRESGDKLLEEKAKQILKRLEAAQEPSGYLGITDPALRTKEKPLRGMDPYELYFTVHGLITAYEELGDKEALQSACRLGDYFVEHIGPGKAEFWPSKLRPPENKNKPLDGQSEIAGHSVHYGWEGTLLIDPMLRLYEVSGDAKYLAWSKWVTENIDKWSGWDAFSKLDQVASGKMGINEVQPYVHSHTFQMNFLGFLRLYQITGDNSYFRKVKGAWDDVASRQIYITGGVSVGEHYERGYHRPLTGSVVETCATMSWMQLTQYLLELTDDVKYADAIERLLWNHVFASQTIDGDCYKYHTPPNGFKPEGYFHGPDCCTASGHRIVSMLPLFFYGQGKNTIYINQFVSSKASFKLENGNTVNIEQQTKYPEEETILLKVEPQKSAEFTINIRMPGWCDNPLVKINGAENMKVKSGAYAKINRVWNKGDVVTLGFPMKLSWVEHDHFEGANAPYALVRGPVVYSLDTVWWNNKVVPAPADVASEAGIVREETAKLRRVSWPKDALGPAYEATVQLISGQRVKAFMLPYTNVGRWYRQGEPKPDRNSRAFSYAIWLQDSNSPAFKTMAEAKQRQKELYKKAFDFVLIGDTASEQAHKFAGDKTIAGEYNGSNWRHASDGGWFEYELKVPSDKAVEILCTYWGNDAGGRKFKILVDGKVAAQQVLENNKPNEFFEQRYPVPIELTQGKEKVTIRFAAEPGNTAGGVFDAVVITVKEK